MRQNVIKVSALLAFVVAACSEPTATEQGQASSAAPKAIATSIGGQLNIVAGNHKIATTGTFPNIDQSVQVLDAAGNPQVGAAVVFTTVTKTGATRSAVGFGTTCSTGAMTASGGGNTITVNTNATGYATTRWCFLGLGGQELNAVTGTGAPVTFYGIATSSGGIPVMAQINGATSGQNNTTMAGQNVPINPLMRLNDPNGTALNGVPLVFTPSSDGKVTGGSCASCAASTVYTGSGGTGMASVIYTLKSTPGANNLVVTAPSYTTSGGIPVASSTFTGTSATLTGLAAGTSMACVSGCANSAVAAANTVFGPKDPAVQISTASGNVGAGVAVAVTFGTGTVSCPGAGNAAVTEVFTNASGVASARWCLSGTPGGTGNKTITFTAGALSTTITASATADFTTNNGSLTIDAGTSFTCTVGGVATPDLAVTFADAQGNKQSGAVITFTAPGDGTVANGTTSGRVINVTTNSAGQAAVRYTCGTTSGSQTVRATSTTNAIADVVGSATAGAAATILITGGNNQTATSGTALTKNPTVKVVDVYGNPVNNVTTTWSASPTTGGSVGQLNVPTGNVGQGSVPGVAANVWTLSTTVGAQTLTVSAAGLTSVVFNATGN